MNELKENNVFRDTRNLEKIMKLGNKHVKTIYKTLPYKEYDC